MFASFQLAPGLLLLLLVRCCCEPATETQQGNNISGTLVVRWGSSSSSLVSSTTSKSRRATAAIADFQDGIFFDTPRLTLLETDTNTSTTYTKLKADLYTVDDGSEEVVWTGTISKMGRVGFATVIQRADGILSGSFSTETSVYTLTTKPDGSVEIEETLWKQDLSSGSGYQGATTRNLGSFERNIAPPSVEMIVNRPKRSLAKSSVAAVHRDRRLWQKERNLQDYVNITVLVVVTHRAQCAAAGFDAGCNVTEANQAVVNQKLIIAEEQTNQAMQSVGVKASVNLVKTVYLTEDYPDYNVTGNETRDALRDDLFFQELRNESAADLVAMVAGDDPVLATNAALNGFDSVSSISQFSFYAFSRALLTNLGKCKAKFWCVCLKLCIL